MVKPVLWIRIRIASVFRSFRDPDPYSEYGYGSTKFLNASSGTYPIWIRIHIHNIGGKPIYKIKKLIAGSFVLKL